LKIPPSAAGDRQKCSDFRWTRLIDGIEPEILAEIEHAPRI